MKSIVITLSVASVLLTEATAEGVAFRDAETSESLSKKYSEVAKSNPLEKFDVTEGKDPTVENRVGNLIENSEIITFNGQTTLVPKNAILQIPDKYKDRINNYKAGTAIVGWLDFHRANPGWISTVGVSLAQAKGLDPIPAEQMEVLAKNGNLVVAVLHKGGPISVLPPKQAETEKPVEKAENEKPVEKAENIEIKKP